MHRRAELMRLLHDPMGYYRPWQQAALQVAPAQRSALNAWLKQRHALPGYSPPPADQIVLAQRLIQGWARLPQAAHLLACGKHRQRLMGSRAFVSLPGQVHAFLRLPFAPCDLVVPDVQDENSLRAWGAAYLLEGLQGRVPHWLHARARLWFAGLPLPPLTLAQGANDFDMTCFWSAWNHAANLS